MPNREPIPVYVFTGFLESGKTQFIKEIIADPDFTENERTALLLCEEGIEEYDEREMMRYGTAIVPIESPERLTPNILKRVEQKYDPDRILIEYNGMWKLDDLIAAFPARWELYQIVTTVDASTFELYSNNMGPMMFEHITTADLVVFNRCTDALKEMLYQKNIRAMNPRATIYLDDVDGNSEDYNRNMPLPFDVDDISFLGFICRWPGAKDLKQRDWVRVTASITVEMLPQYRGEGPVLHATEVIPAEKPAEELVYFN